MRGDLVTKAELRSLSGRERLRLLYVEVGNDGLDFHSLALESLEEDTWQSQVVISQDDFQAEHKYRRWVSDLHSFSPVARCAVVQVAEGNRPPGSFSVSYVYSWRRWDLSSNRELAVLRVCKSPFEPL